MAHEKSITIKRADGKWVNIPTVIGGETVSEEAAVRALANGTTRPLGGRSFATMREAVAAAKKRSENFRPTGKGLLSGIGR